MLLDVDHFKHSTIPMAIVQVMKPCGLSPESLRGAMRQMDLVHATEARSSL